MKSIPGVKAKALESEKKREPGAYLLHNGKTLCCVIGMVGVGLLRVEIANGPATGSEMSLRAIDVQQTKYIRGPETLQIPDHFPDELAA